MLTKHYTTNTKSDFNFITYIKVCSRLNVNIQNTMLTDGKMDRNINQHSKTLNNAKCNAVVRCEI